ncbi:MAG: hypothetical protein Q4G36_10750 [Paracoccus sp. (in: a-proteobacteria)]|nr:hypothetical protein [Paracoccus sp. (in: a-proteobacteria)]
MKAFLAALVATFAIAFLASTVLSGMQQTAPEAYATEGARVGDPGNNLVRF